MTAFSLLWAWTTMMAVAVEDEPPAREDLITPYERTGGEETPRYAETVEFCQRLARHSPRARYVPFGVSPQGRELPLVIVDGDSRFQPEEVRGAGKVVVLLQACIHAGEVCGKDAGLELLKDLLLEDDGWRDMEHVTLLFIPIFNVDGHERFGPYNRINQNGPREMGWRTTARNLNLNRDYMKADAPEMQAWMRLFQAWLPDFFIDVHSTNGADYQYVLTYGMEVHGSMDRQVTRWTRRYLDWANEAMARAGFPMSPYVTFRDWSNPRSGMEVWVAPPRFSQGYVAMQNRPGLLVETHMLKDYALRVRSTQLLTAATLKYVNEHHRELRSVVQEADRRASSGELRSSPFPLGFRTTGTAREIDFLGIDYVVVSSEVSGGDWIQYTGQPKTFRIPYYDEVAVASSVELPLAYVIPPEWPDLLERLRLHGVRWQHLEKPARVAIRSYRFEDVAWKVGKNAPYEGRHRAEFKLVPVRERRSLAAGSAVVKLDQRAARVLVHALEPKGLDSFARWGFFDSIFQRTEYAESYVMEKMARTMLTDNPKLKAELEAAKKADPSLAGSPRAILQWFYQRTPYYDRSHNLYPVALVDDEGVLRSLPVAVE